MHPSQHLERQQRANLLMEEVDRLARMPPTHSDSDALSGSHTALPRLTGALGLSHSASLVTLSLPSRRASGPHHDLIGTQSRADLALPTGFGQSVVRQASPRVDIGPFRGSAARRGAQLTSRERAAPYIPPFSKQTLPVSCAPSLFKDPDLEPVPLVRRASRDEISDAEFLLSLSPGTSSSALDTCVSLLATPDLDAISRSHDLSERNNGKSGLMSPGLPSSPSGGISSSPPGGLPGNLPCDSTSLLRSALGDPLGYGIGRPPTLPGGSLSLSEIPVSCTPSVADLVANHRLQHCDGWGRGDRVPFAGLRNVPFAGLRNEPAPPFHAIRSEPAPSPLSSVSVSSTHAPGCGSDLSPCTGWSRGERSGESLSERRTPSATDAAAPSRRLTANAKSG